MEKMKIEKDGIKVEISSIGTFKVPDLNKEYIMYSLIDNNENNIDGKMLIGEVIEEDNAKKIVGIKPEEKELVVAYYNEISTQLGGE